MKLKPVPVPEPTLGIGIPQWTRSSDINDFKECELKWWLRHLYADERPTPTWFPLGTAVHHAIEQDLRGEVHTLEACQAAARETLEQLLSEATEIMPRPAGTRSKRSIDTVYEDADRMIAKYWTHVRPGGAARAVAFDNLVWPPKYIEHQISVEIPHIGLLNTTVDAVFERTDNDFLTIVDWKSGGTAGKSKSLQLWTYLYGLKQEGIVPEHQHFPGFFVHLDFIDGVKGIQHAGEYPGDEVIRRWIYQTARRKAETHLHGALPTQDWWCKYCDARQFCPVEGEGSWEDIESRLDRVEWLAKPKEES